MFSRKENRNLQEMKVWNWLGENRKYRTQESFMSSFPEFKKKEADRTLNKR